MRCVICGPSIGLECLVSLRKLIMASVIAPIMLGACTSGQQARGYIFDQQLADAILPGVDNRQSVAATLGMPTIAGSFDENKWYYVSTLVNIRPVYWPKAQNHRVLAVSFNDKGVVSDISNYGLSDRREIIPVEDITPTRGRDLNIFQQLFSNIGRFAGGPAGGGPQGPTRTPNG